MQVSEVSHVSPPSTLSFIPATKLKAKKQELGYLVLHFSPWRRQTKLEAQRQEVESSVPHFSLDGRQQCLTLGRETGIFSPSLQLL